MIKALQHVGQGVRDVDTTYGFYKKHFGFSANQRVRLPRS
jgi:catechol 2,3-dioxygenase-like lactoylglutathione lyase family enzyme